MSAVRRPSRSVNSRVTSSSSSGRRGTTTTTTSANSPLNNNNATAAVGGDSKPKTSLPLDPSWYMLPSLPATIQGSASAPKHRMVTIHLRAVGMPMDTVMRVPPETPISLLKEKISQHHGGSIEHLDLFTQMIKDRIDERSIIGFGGRNLTNLTVREVWSLHETAAATNAATATTGATEPMHLTPQQLNPHHPLLHGVGGVPVNNTSLSAAQTSSSMNASSNASAASLVTTAVAVSHLNAANFGATTTTTGSSSSSHSLGQSTSQFSRSHMLSSSDRSSPSSNQQQQQQTSPRSNNNNNNNNRNSASPEATAAGNKNMNQTVTFANTTSSNSMNSSSVGMPGGVTSTSSSSVGFDSKHPSSSMIRSTSQQSQQSMGSPSSSINFSNKNLSSSSVSQGGVVPPMSPTSSYSHYQQHGFPSSSSSHHQSAAGPGSQYATATAEPSNYFIENNSKVTKKPPSSMSPERVPESSIYPEDDHVLCYYTFGPHAKKSPLLFA